MEADDGLLGHGKDVGWIQRQRNPPLGTPPRFEPRPKRKRPRLRGAVQVLGAGTGFEPVTFRL